MIRLFCDGFYPSFFKCTRFTAQLSQHDVFSYHPGKVEDSLINLSLYDAAVFRSVGLRRDRVLYLLHVCRSSTAEASRA